MKTRKGALDDNHI